MCTRGSWRASTRNGRYPGGRTRSNSHRLVQSDPRLVGHTRSCRHIRPLHQRRRLSHRARYGHGRLSVRAPVSLRGARGNNRPSDIGDSGGCGDAAVTYLSRSRSEPPDERWGGDPSSDRRGAESECTLHNRREHSADGIPINIRCYLNVSMRGSKGCIQCGSNPHMHLKPALRVALRSCNRQHGLRWWRV